VDIVSSRMILTQNLPSDQTTAEVHDIIRATGQFVDDISARYFKGFHSHLPIISHSRFYNKLTTLGAAQASDFSVLLLTICLITYAPALGHQSEKRRRSICRTAVLISHCEVHLCPGSSILLTLYPPNTSQSFASRVRVYTGTAGRCICNHCMQCADCLRRPHP
jgi:hypothetical protein